MICCIGYKSAHYQVSISTFANVYIYSRIFLFQPRTVTTGRGFRDWHFFCVIWNGLEGEIGLFLDGYVVDAFQHNENLKAQLSPGKLFIVGSLDGGDLEDLGRLSQLNIWDYEISTANVLAMSAGGFNIHGSVLSWGNLATYVLATTMHRNTEIYLPGRLTKLFFCYFKE